MSKHKPKPQPDLTVPDLAAAYPDDWMRLRDFARAYPQYTHAGLQHFHRWRETNGAAEAGVFCYFGRTPMVNPRRLMVWLAQHTAERARQYREMVGYPEPTPPAPEAEEEAA